MNRAMLSVSVVAILPRSVVALELKCYQDTVFRHLKAYAKCAYSIKSRTSAGQKTISGRTPSTLTNLNKYWKRQALTLYFWDSWFFDAQADWGELQVSTLRELGKKLPCTTRIPATGVFYPHKVFAIQPLF